MHIFPLASANILSHLIAFYLYRSPSYVEGQNAWAAWVAWGCLALGCYLYSRRKVTDDHLVHNFPASSEKFSLHSEILTSGLALLCFALQSVDHFFGPDLQIRWALPLTTITTSVVAAYLAHSKSRVKAPDVQPLQSWPNDPIFSSIGKLGQPFFILVGASIVVGITLAPPVAELNASTILLGLSYVLITTSLYTLLPTFTGGNDESSESVPVSALQRLSIRVFAVCTLGLALHPPQVARLDFFVLVQGTVQLVQNFTMLVLCAKSASIAVTGLDTTSYLIGEALVVRDLSSSMTLTVLTMVSLLQTIFFLPKSIASRIWFLVLLLLPLSSVFHLTGLVGAPGQTLVPGSSTQEVLGTDHPIQQIFKSANQRFTTLLAGQSTTLTAAVAEYRRRYGRLPPPGFDRWFEVAKAKNFQLMDEFDTVMQSLEPFWGIEPAVLRAQVKALKEASNSVQVHVRRNETISNGDDNHSYVIKEKWLNRTTYGDIFPEATFSLSLLDEPRIVAPEDAVERAIQIASAQKKGGKSAHKVPQAAIHPQAIKWINIRHQQAWDAIMSSCPINSPVRSDISTTTSGGALKFVSNVTANMDSCENMDLLEHGFFIAPASMLITHSLVPMFAQAKPKVFNDILYPSPYYYNELKPEDDVDEEDVPWDEKKDRLYWTGSTTGGLSTTSNWMKLHRQRITLMTSADSTMLVKLLQRGLNGLWQVHQTTWASISKLFYVRITATPQCHEEACEEQEKAFKTKEGGWESAGEALHNKYVLDMDGNSYSGRYYRLLKSKACVLKYTAFQEWHDGRVLPWVHFVPVSANAEELGELMRYFTEEDEGREIGRAIAEQGSEWTRKTLRGDDMEVFFVRMFLEYARILDDDRDQLNFRSTG